MTNKAQLRSWEHMRTPDGSVFHDGLAGLSTRPMMDRPGLYVDGGISPRSMAMLAPINNLINRLDQNSDMSLPQRLEEFSERSPEEYRELADRAAFGGLITVCRHSGRELKHVPIRDVDDQEAERLVELARLSD
jgi:hypothetical protein